jgi:hypothetical protein
VGHIDKNIGDRTRSNIQAKYNPTNHVVFFPLHDAIKFKVKGNLKKKSAVRTY